MFTAIQAGGGFLGTTLNVLGEATRYCVLMLVMAIICFQAPSLASALTGGAAIQQGVQMIQNVLMVAGLRAVSTGRVALPPSSPNGGVIRASAATLAAAPFAGVATAGTTNVFRQGYGFARTAAYKLAALRGRS